MKSGPLGRLVHTKRRYGPGCVHKNGITHLEFHSFIVLDHCGLTSDLEQHVVVIDSVKPNVPLGSLDSLGIALDVKHIQAGYASRIYSTNKRFRDDARRIETAAI